MSRLGGNNRARMAFTSSSVSLFWIRFHPIPSIPSPRAKIFAAITGYAILSATVTAIFAWPAPT